MTKQEKETISILHRQLQQSLEYLHCGRVDDGRIVAEIVERELGKLVNKQKNQIGPSGLFYWVEYENRNTALQNDTAPLYVSIVYYRRFN
ncbi:hypothetical protein [Proteus mirabilis]|uniref:hypothetical protein n=1 Tax=Proteus mirabilis TaxID=584 RepID=UPI00155E6949|nr:hypothetical protein [Proteus mirabilis]QKG47319.1 hypothetical protein HRD56_07025 [Proteus mirabilis]